VNLLKNKKKQKTTNLAYLKIEQCWLCFASFIIILQREINCSRA